MGGGKQPQKRKPQGGNWQRYGEGWGEGTEDSDRKTCSSAAVSASIGSEPPVSGSKQACWKPLEGAW